MEDTGRVAIGTVAMRNKEYLTAIRPLDGVLAMSTMRFADEVVPRKDIKELPSRKSKPAPKDMQMAKQLIESLAGDWDPKQYHDTYAEELKARIKATDKGKDVVEADDDLEPTAEVIDLSEALQRSLDSAKGGSRKRRPAAQGRSSKSA